MSHPLLSGKREVTGNFFQMRFGSTKFEELRAGFVVRFMVRVWKSEVEYTDYHYQVIADDEYAVWMGVGRSERRLRELVAVLMGKLLTELEEIRKRARLGQFKREGQRAYRQYRRVELLPWKERDDFRFGCC